MSVRLLVVLASALILTAGCASTIAGSPVAATAVASAPTGDGGAESAGPGESDGDLPLPGDPSGESSPSLGGDQGVPDLSGILDGLGGEGGAGDMPDLGALLDQLGGAAGDIPDLGELLDSSGAGAGALSGIMAPECLGVANTSMAVGMLFLAPATGQSLTTESVEKAFASLTSVPPELAGDVETLRQASLAAVGASVQQTTELLGSPEVSTAMEHLGNYLEQHCSGN